MAARVVASGLSVSAKYRPEINYDNKYPYINYSRAAVVSYIRVYHQQRDLFHVVALFLQPRKVHRWPYTSFYPNLPPEHQYFALYLKIQVQSTPDSSSQTYIKVEGNLLVNLSDSAPSCPPQRLEFQWPSRPWCPD